MNLTSHQFAKWLCGAILAAEALWGVLVAFVPAAGQDRAFCCQGNAWFLDYQAPREWAVDKRHYHPETKDRWDISCYPPISYDLAKLFPRGTSVGGPIFATVAALLMALGVFTLARRLFDNGCEAGLATVLVGFSFPAIFAFSTGNSLPIAVGAVSLFFAWKDDRSRLRQFTAFASLAFAIALKVSPVFFALTLLVERRWRDIATVAILAAALTFVPFLWYGGWTAFTDFLACLQNRAGYYGIRDSWGFVGLDRCLRLGLGLGVESTRATYPLSRSLNVVFALACLVAGMLRSLAETKGETKSPRALLLLSIAMLMLPGGSVIYNSLLLVPALLVNLAGMKADVWKPDIPLTLQGLSWFVLLCTLQLPFSFSSVNIPASAIAIIVLGVSVLGWPRLSRGH